jgi:uncharacterized protein
MLAITLARETPMTPEERQLIAGLFDRMRSYGAPDKDREAEALISQSVRANPDATYMLVQSVLVQEQALEAANARVMELEEQLRGEEPRSSRSGGFLGGGYWGDRRGEAPASSVPQVGARATPSAYENRPSSAWSQTPPPPPPQQPAPQASGGGGFMKSALATAAGVAGGVLVADSIRNMMGGGAQASPFGRSRDDAPTEEVAEEDSDSYDSDSDSGSDGDTGGDGGGEIEV